MVMPIVLRPETEADLLQAQDWYQQESSELAEAFADRFKPKRCQWRQSNSR